MSNKKTITLIEKGVYVSSLFIATILLELIFPFLYIEVILVDGPIILKIVGLLICIPTLVAIPALMIFNSIERIITDAIVKGNGKGDIVSAYIIYSIFSIAFSYWIFHLFKATDYMFFNWLFGASCICIIVLISWYMISKTKGIEISLNKELEEWHYELKRTVDYYLQQIQDGYLSYTGAKLLVYIRIQDPKKIGRCLQMLEEHYKELTESEKEEDFDYF